ncbi:MAG: hypothetical protein K2X80_02810 [Pseudomonadaceae bacterium]|nr:hypothetical protein [Pseudomonadaceae bacterium]
MSEKNVIMYDSPEAATLQTITGWVSSDGRFYGSDEALARYAGSTHRQCAANPNHSIYETRGYCQVCAEEKRQAQFKAMPRKPWNGEPLVLFDGDRYFFDLDHLRDYIVDEGIKVADLQACICEPNMASEIDLEDYFVDDLPDDGEINDDDILAAGELLNEMIRKAPPLSWSQGKYVAELPQSFLDEVSNVREAP